MSQKDTAKSIHQRLLNIRDKTGEDFNHLLVRYGLERLLYRLVLTGHADSFVLKGAMLFTIWQDVPARPTRDIDLLGLGHPTHERLRQIFTDTCHAEMEKDGLTLDPLFIQTQDIRSDQEYAGIRIRMLGFLDNTRIPIQIDVGFGDAIVPPPEKIDVPCLLDLPAPRLAAYHPATVIAEKVNAMVVHGLPYSRMKDLYDLYILLNHRTLDDDLLAESIAATFHRRKTELPRELPAAFTPEFLSYGNKEIQWQAFLNRSRLFDFGLTIAEVLNALRERIWSILQKAQKFPR